jgi:hypothetical protein
MSLQIRKRILEVKTRLLMELITEDNSFSSEIQEMGLKAINAGPKSQELEDYMQLFAETPEALARLMALDGTENLPGMNRARAYLLADSTCGTETVQHFGKNTSLLLDPPNPTP